MSKKVFVLVHDYWHHDDSIKPMMDYLFNADYEVTFTKNPNDYFKGQFDLFLSFKDPIENDQIPTPIWCDEKWTEKFLNDVQNGMGTIMFHASLTDYPENHAILTNVVRSNFITHPEQCPLTVKPIAEHPIIEGIGKFTFPDFDEHYVMKMMIQRFLQKPFQRTAFSLLYGFTPMAREKSAVSFLHTLPKI